MWSGRGRVLGAVDARDGLSAGADLEFLVDTFDVSSDGGVGDVETTGDLLVKEAF